MGRSLTTCVYGRLGERGRKIFAPERLDGSLVLGTPGGLQSRRSQVRFLGGPLFYTSLMLGTSGRLQPFRSRVRFLGDVLLVFV